MLLALIPALQPALQHPLLPRPQPVVAQAPPLTQAAVFPTRGTSPPPQSLPRAEAGDEAPPPAAVAWRPPPAPAQPWVLLIMSNQLFGDFRTTPQGRFTTQEACEHALEYPWGQQAKQLEHQAKLGQKGLVVWHREGKWHWEQIAGSKQVINEAWCEKD